MRRMLEAKEVAEALGVSMATLYGWRYRTRPGSPVGPPSHKIGKLLRYDPEDVERWLAENRKAS